MNAVRARVVRRAFETLDSSKDGFVSKQEMERWYDTQRHPSVLRREVSPGEALSRLLDAFDTSGDGRVSYEEWVAYYKNLSSTVEDDGDFHMIVTRTWQLDQPTRMSQDVLRAAIGEGFKSSAYRSTDAACSPGAAPENASAPGAASTLTVERAQLSLDPMPMPKAGVAPKSAISFLDSSKQQHHRVTTRGATQVSVPSPDGHSTLGSTGRPGSLGFLNDRTSTQRGVGTGEFDPAVLEAYKRGKEAENAAAQRRRELQAAPFATAEPTAYARSSQVHGALNAAVNRDRPANPHSPPKEGSPVTEDDLRRVLEQQREDLRKTISVSRTKGNSMTTTQREHFSALDTTAAMEAADRFAGKPYNRTATADAPEPRGANGWETEYSSRMVDRHNEVEREGKNHCRGTFRLVNGVPQMSAVAHQPRAVTGTGAKPGSVVPGHFTSTQKSMYS